MEALTDQIEASLGSGLYFLSLYTALTVPDIAAALESEDGQATGARYAAWFEIWIRPRFQEIALAHIPVERRPHITLENPLTGRDCYRFRCSLLHQGSSQHPESSVGRIIFIEPGATTNVFHYGRMGDALCIDLNLFCREIIQGARMWLDQVAQDPNYIRNQKRFARRHAHGLLPYFEGVAVVG